MVNSIKEIHLVLEKVVKEVSDGKEKIINIIENLRGEFERDKLELERVLVQLANIIKEVDQLEKKDREMRRDLSKASSNLTLDEKVISQIYKEALDTKVLFISKEKEEKELRIRRDKLELSLKNYLKNIEDAEEVIGQINIVVRFLNNDLGNSLDNIEELSEKDVTLRILEAQEEERRRIAREVHDGPAQYLASSLMRVDLVKRVMKEDVEKGINELEELKQLISRTLKEVRSVIYNLRPPYLEKQSIQDLIQDLADSFVDESRMDLNIRLGKYEKRDYRVEVGIYRIIQELFNNAKKHSKGHGVTVALEQSQGMIFISFKDDGIGFDVDNVLEDVRLNRNSYGIVGILDRVKGLRGEVTITSNSNSGTKYFIKIPV